MHCWSAVPQALTIDPAYFAPMWFGLGSDSVSDAVSDVPFAKGHETLPTQRQ